MGTGVTIAFVIALLVLLLLSAIFSATEAAYYAVSPATIEANLKARKRSALLIKKHYGKFGWTLATILISNNLVNVGTASIATYLLTSLITDGGLVTLISTVVVTVVVVIFGEIIPKLLASRFAYRYLTIVVYIVEVLNWLFFPLTFPLARFAFRTRVTHTEVELRHLLALASQEGVLETQEATLAQKALDLDSLPISKIMARSRDINALPAGIDVAQAKQLFALKTYSRMPIKSKRGYTGVLLMKDIIFEPETRLIDELSQPLLYLSRHTTASKALEQMRISKSQMALVTPSRKSNAVIGLITLEDILEALVGEIYDEHDREVLIREVAHFKWVAEAEVAWSLVAKEIGIAIDEVPELSLRQWMSKQVGQRLAKDTRLLVNGLYEFKVIANSRRNGMLIQITKQSRKRKG